MANVICLVAENHPDASGRLQYKMQSYRALLKNALGGKPKRSKSPSQSPKSTVKKRRASDSGHRKPDPEAMADNHPDGDPEEDLKFLHTIIHPWEDVVLKWRNTRGLRNSEISGDAKCELHEIVAKYPALKTNKGIDLVSTFYILRILQLRKEQITKAPQITHLF